MLLVVSSVLGKASSKELRVNRVKISRMSKEVIDNVEENLLKL